MALIPTQDHLTVIDEKFETKRARTSPGMAHFAATGPPHTTCRECAFWDNCGVAAGYYSAGGKHGGVLKPRSCHKYMELMGGVQGPPIVFAAASCKYFKPEPEPPAILEKW